MKRLEQYIQDNKRLFEEEPEVGHFGRLQQKMEQTHRKVVLLRRASVAAASVILLLSASMLWHYTRQPANTVVVCESTEDMKHCYLDKMNDVAGQIVELTKDFDQWDKQQVMMDVQSIIDATNSDFEMEIPGELSDEAAKSILSDYYQQNLESLHSIVETLEE